MGACVKLGMSERKEKSAQIEAFLDENPDFLETYVAKNVDQEVVENWILSRNKIAQSRKCSLSKWKFGGATGSKRNMLNELTKSIHRGSHEQSFLLELSICISSAVNADGYTLYSANKLSDVLKPILSHGDSEEYKISDGAVMAAFVAKEEQPMRLSSQEAEARFPRGMGDDKEVRRAAHVLCHPIVRADEQIIAVLQLYRNDSNDPFYVEDEEVVNSYVLWGGIALHYAELNRIMNKSKNLNDFLLDVVRSIFQDMVSMGTLIKKIMNFAQRLTDADRASLFLLDHKNNELYARLFDMGGGQDFGTPSDLNAHQPAKEIRFPIGTGIAGQVAETGQILNIPDAYQDERFNRNVDQITGYQTKSILCMPVFIRSTVIGVVQMVNKKHGTFTKDDEESFATFAVYCGLALHHAKLHDKIRRSEQKFKVALEVLSYHSSCDEGEFRKYKQHGVPKSVVGLDEFYFAPMSIDDAQKVHYALYMFIDLFGLARFDVDTLYRFVLTVKKNYRRVPYHNWTHGFTVAHSMYCILKRSNIFLPLECLALFVGSLCHDLDHRGRSNKFMTDTASPLAAIYTTSTMEHHHFNQTVTILQQDSHNIFLKLSCEEYKQVLGNIKHCILATDLAQFFPNKARLNELVDNNQFSWEEPTHRLLVQAIAMTAADLCASAKPWDAQIETVRVIFEEFYEQGDLEKQQGRTPMPMMDRNRKDELPATQVGFLSGICCPCYNLLYRLVPETLDLKMGVERNLLKWKKLAEEKKNDPTSELDEDESEYPGIPRDVKSTSEDVHGDKNRILNEYTHQEESLTLQELFRNP